MHARRHCCVDVLDAFQATKDELTIFKSALANVTRQVEEVSVLTLDHVGGVVFKHPVAAGLPLCQRSASFACSAPLRATRSTPYTSQGENTGQDWWWKCSQEGKLVWFPSWDGSVDRVGLPAAWVSQAHGSIAGIWHSTQAPSWWYGMIMFLRQLLPSQQTHCRYWAQSRSDPQAVPG